MGKVFGFQKQLAVGKEGENLFIDSYFDVEKADGIKFDFKFGDKTVELKTDGYHMDKTPNFFMERYSDLVRKTPGGPWRAYQDKVDYFVYLFLPDRTFFWFTPRSLCLTLDKLINASALTKKTIKNRTWNTIGYPVARVLCDKICLRVDHG